jgi:glutathione S-transferase
MKNILYQYEISPFCDKVRRAMRLKGLAWETVEVPIMPGRYKHISPTGKFPALDHGGRVIVDSTEIIAFLDTLAGPKLVPDEPRARAQALILEDWADESLYFFDVTMRNWPQNRQWFIDDLLAHEHGWQRGILARMIPGALRKVAVNQGTGRKSESVVAADLARHYDSLEALLDGHSFLVGEVISIADVAVRSMVFVLDRTIEGKALHDARPRLSAWSTRIDRLTL